MFGYNQDSRLTNKMDTCNTMQRLQLNMVYQNRVHLNPRLEIIFANQHHFRMWSRININNDNNSDDSKQVHPDDIKDMKNCHCRRYANNQEQFQSHKFKHKGTRQFQTPSKYI